MSESDDAKVKFHQMVARTQADPKYIARRNAMIAAAIAAKEKNDE